MLRAVLNKIFGNASEEPANPVQTTEQELVEVDANVVVSAEETTEQNSEEEFVEVNSEDVAEYEEETMEQEPESFIVSRVVRPLLYTTKYGAQVVYLTASGIGNISIVVSYGLSGVACIPHGISKALEEREEQNKETAGYLHTTEHKVIVCVKNVLSGTADVLHGGAHILKGAGQAVVYFGDVAYCVNQSLPPEKIEEICTDTDSSIKALSGKLQEIIGINNVVQPALAAS